MQARFERTGRLLQIRVAPDFPESFIVAEDVELFSVAYPDAIFPPPLAAAGGNLQVPDARLVSQDEARLEIVRRTLATSIPTTAAALAASLALPLRETQGMLATLEANGAIFRGFFTTARPPMSQICHGWHCSRMVTVPMRTKTPSNGAIVTSLNGSTGRR